MKIYAETYSGNITIVCLQDACKNMVINIYGMISAHLHCLGDEACKNLVIHFEDMDNVNSTSSVSCYEYNACPGLRIYTDGPSTQLKMYQYSKDIKIYNHYGYFEADQTVQCGLDDKYIQYQFDHLLYDPALEQLVESEYDNYLLPCSNVTIFCDKFNDSRINDLCSMKYVYNTGNLERFDQQKFENYTCGNVELIDIVHLKCHGNCIGSPTKAPTFSPTSQPTNAPFYSPSNAPTISPSVAPSLTPSNAPSRLPSISPTATPTTSPSISPTTLTGIPTMAPTTSPTLPPSLSPTLGPTQSPSRYPTSLNDFNELDSKIDISYKLSNLVQRNYDLIKDPKSNKAIEQMEQILEMNYFDANYLPKYSYFQISINKINEIAIKDKKIRNLDEDGIIYVKATILLQSNYAFEIIARSKSSPFSNITRNAFRRYFENDNLNFSVVDASGLAVEKLPSEAEDESAVSIWIIIVIILSVLIVTISGVILFQKSKTRESINEANEQLKDDEYKRKSMMENIHHQHEQHGEVEGQTVNNSSMVHGEIDNAAAAAEGIHHHSDDSSTEDEDSDIEIEMIAKQSEVHSSQI